MLARIRINDIIIQKIELSMGILTGILTKELRTYIHPNLDATTFDFPKGVTSIGDDAFEGCRGLTSIELPRDLKSIGEGAFRDCSGLTSIKIPEGVTSIGYNAFRGCSELTSIKIP